MHNENQRMQTLKTTGDFFNPQIPHHTHRSCTKFFSWDSASNKLLLLEYFNQDLNTHQTLNLMVYSVIWETDNFPGLPQMILKVYVGSVSSELSPGRTKKTTFAFKLNIVTLLVSDFGKE